MKKKLLRRGLVVGIIILFVGAGVVSGLGCGTEPFNKEFKEKKGTPDRGEVTKHPVADTSIKQFLPDNNFGSDAHLIVRNECGGLGERIYEDDILIRFDVSDLSGKTIYSAELRLWYDKYSQNDPKGRPLTLYRVMSPWEENIVTWNTRPAWSSTVIDSYNVPVTPGGWMEWDVTNEVQDFVNGADNYGWCIMDETDWCDYDIPATWFCSKEHSVVEHCPELYIHYKQSRSSNLPNLNLLEQLSIRFPLLAQLLQLLILTEF